MIFNSSAVGVAVGRSVGVKSFSPFQPRQKLSTHPWNSIGEEGCVRTGWRQISLGVRNGNADVNAENVNVNVDVNVNENENENEESVNVNVKRGGWEWDEVWVHPG